VLVEMARTRGPYHSCTMYHLRRLAILYGELDRVDEAANLHAQVMSNFKAEFGWASGATVRAIANYGFALIQQDKYDNSRRLVETATEKSKAHLGPKHPVTLLS
ncbi:hypothetical protein K458DRAFT_281012, partial [Lentithecium fluviatile CBS 122367]